MSQQPTSKSFNQARGEASDRLKKITKIAILSALAFLLMLAEFAVPLMPAFLKFDFSEIPALLAAFSMGPIAGFMVEAIKNLLHLPFTQTMMIGELANLLIGSALVVTAGLIYQRNKDKKHAILGLVAGTLMMTVIGALFNYYINIPFYVQVMGFELESIIGMTQAAGNTMVTDLASLITWVFVPFNILKGTLISVIVIFIYKPLSGLLHH